MNLKKKYIVGTKNNGKVKILREFDHEPTYEEIKHEMTANGLTKIQVGVGYEMVDEEEDFICIDNTKLAISSKEFTIINTLRTTVGTTGYCGGDAGHGGKTYFSITNVDGTDMKTYEFANGIGLLVRGDSELNTLIDALEWIVGKLKEKTRGKA